MQRNHRQETRRWIEAFDPVMPAHPAADVDVFKHMGQHHEKQSIGEIRTSCATTKEAGASCAEMMME